jgi:nicotinate-nucleotide pyrophosphorylase (carboxylating)
MFSINEDLAAGRARNIEDALREDVGRADYTALLVPDAPALAVLTVRESAVLCGRDWFEGCFRRLEANVAFDWAYAEGDLMRANSTVCRVSGRAHALLTGERPALNFLQLLSATATSARTHAEAIAGASPNPRGCQVLDTRKTIPGLRQAQKYAVRVGGGANQRLALWDGILIKENHIAASGGIAPALQAARALNAGVSIQIEVESLDELRQALDAGAESILLDNFGLQEMREAVEITQRHPQHAVTVRAPALLEASGGLGLEDLRAVAATGVDRISVGRLTKDVKAVDYSLRIVANR